MSKKRHTVVVMSADDTCGGAYRDLIVSVVKCETATLETLLLSESLESLMSDIGSLMELMRH